MLFLDICSETENCLGEANKSGPDEWIRLDMNDGATAHTYRRTMEYICAIVTPDRVVSCGQSGLHPSWSSRSPDLSVFVGNP
ncbi:hypothetical protein TNCV_4249331 [Trichonephila clavipes]|nr:hypothetical protein TNCV_4249331 [Trichonephila clavipes]